jgi:hypothetical protein
MPDHVHAATTSIGVMEHWRDGRLIFQNSTLHYSITPAF